MTQRRGSSSPGSRAGIGSVEPSSTITTSSSTSCCRSAAETAVLHMSGQRSRVGMTTVTSGGITLPVELEPTWLDQRDGAGWIGAPKSLKSSSCRREWNGGADGECSGEDDVPD